MNDLLSERDLFVLIHLFNFLKTLGQLFVLEPPIYFIVWLVVREASFGAFVIRTLSYTSNQCTIFSQQFSFFAVEMNE